MRERGLKSHYEKVKIGRMSRSREGAWIEMHKGIGCYTNGDGRSREGAWIEILLMHLYPTPSTVAPVRERGLKSNKPNNTILINCRSREGAWIEIS